MSPKKPIPHKNPKPNPNDQRDIVILYELFQPCSYTAFKVNYSVLGATGSGKSTFINALLGENRMAIGDTQDSCTKELSTAAVDSSKFPHHLWLQNRRLLLVDTPGFDNADRTDLEILEAIAKWLEDSYRNNKVLGGVIYLYDISHDRIPGSARQNLVFINKACGNDALDKVALVTTKSHSLDPSEAAKRESRLQKIHWASMINNGAQVFPFNEDFPSASKLVNAVLERFRGGIVLEIQRELVDEAKPFTKTKAGRDGWLHQIRWKNLLQRVLPFKT